ncbi:MAG: T9SS type A sorting domain-containing protein [Balneolaceae bacterium]
MWFDTGFSMALGGPKALEQSLPGVEGSIHTVIWDAGYLYAAGSITSAGGEPLSGVARFHVDSGEWESLGLECIENCQISAMAIVDNNLYVSGVITLPDEGDGEANTFTIGRYHFANEVWEFEGAPLTRGSQPARIHSMVKVDGNLYLGGDFNSAGSVSVNNIAGFNLAGGVWFSLGDGVSEPVQDLAVHENLLHVATTLGSGTTVGNGLDVSGIPVYDVSVENHGNQGWSVFGDISLEFLDREVFDPVINAIHIDDGTMFFGGTFDQVNGSFAFSFASYNFAADEWNTYPDGRFDIVNNITTLNDFVYISTPNHIDTEENVPSMVRIELFQGSNWEPFAKNAFDGDILALTSGLDNIYAAGNFSRVSSQTNTGSVAGYNPVKNSWFTLGTFWDDDKLAVSGGEVFTSIVASGTVFAGGNFTFSDGEPLNRVAWFDASNGGWSSLGQGIADESVFALQSDDNYLYAGGNFTALQNGENAGGVVRYNRSAETWAPLGAGVTSDDGPATVYALLLLENDLYIAGNFSAANGTDAQNIARYNFENESWHAVGPGTNGTIQTVHYVDGSLVVGGSFNQAGNISANNIAFYNVEEETWRPAGNGVSSSSGTAVVSDVVSITNTRLYVGGTFDGAGEISASNFAFYDLQDESWKAVSGGPDGPVNSMVLYGDNIFVGGTFATAGLANQANNIVRYQWERNEWLNLATGTDGEVHTLTPFADYLYMGGAFQNPASRFIRWGGVSGFAGGSGAEGDPFLVDTEQALNRVGYFYESHFSQIAEITYPVGVAGKPNGTAEIPFRGSYNGNGYAIINWNYFMTQTDPRSRSYVGLFGKTDGARLSDIHLMDTNIRAFPSENTLFTGGLAAHAHNTEITRSTVSGRVSGSENVGGLLGAASGSTQVKKSYYTQGIGSTFEPLMNVQGAVNVGGFVGLHQGGVISNAFAHGSVHASGNNSDNIGGFAGSVLEGAEIHSSYSIAEIVGDDLGANAGGFAGFVDGGIAENVYWNTEISTMDNDLVATHLLTAEMKQPESFEFDFNEIWDIREGTTFPFLRSDNTIGGIGPASYGTVVAGGPQIDGEEGWRYFGLSFNNSGSYSEFTRDLTTQGFSGADIPNGTSNIYNYSNVNNGWQRISSISPNSNGPEENPFAMFVFAPPLETTVSFQPIVSMYRNPAMEEQTPTKGFEVNQIDPGNEVSGGTWTLMANNNLWPVTFNEFELEGIREVVYVYDANLPGYVSWNGQSGDLEGGIIRPFQGFFMQTMEENATITIPASALIKNGADVENQFADSPSLRLAVTTADGYKSSTWVGFNDGKTTRNAQKLKPLDFKPFAELAIGKGGQLYDIVNFSEEENGEIRLPLHLNLYETAQTGSDWIAVPAGFTLEWSGLDRFPEDWSLELYRESNDSYINLRTEGSHQISTAPASEKLSYSTAQQNTDTAKGYSGYQLVITPGATVQAPEPSELPNEIVLHQNYPNPFNPSTSINFSLPEGADVTLQVYNVLGQRVALVMDQHIEAGEHTIPFDATNLSSGVYIYRLTAGSQVLTRKMTLIK